MIERTPEDTARFSSDMERAAARRNAQLIDEFEAALGTISRVAQALEGRKSTLTLDQLASLAGSCDSGMYDLRTFGGEITAARA